MELESRKSDFWMEYPLTTGMTILIIFFYFLLFVLPTQIVQTYFFSYPGRFNFVNWLLSTLAHASFFHLAWNCLFLIFLGRAVEAKVGPGKWIMFYLMAALMSGFGDSFVRGIIQSDTNPTVGASGAISGIAVVAALLSPYTIPIKGKNFPFPVFFLAWVMIYSDLMSFDKNDNIAHWSHIGGYVSVLLTAYFLSEKDKEKLKIGFYMNLLFFSLSMILFYFIKNR
jgi:membrane associated rhomboid family serine protease